MSRGKRKQIAPDFISVPGGVVHIDIYRGQEHGEFLAKNAAKAALNPYSVNHIKRDIVIEDETRQRELYREGPYDVRSVVRPLDRILAQIREVGLDQFLSSRRDPRSLPGTINVLRETETFGQIYEKAIWTDIGYHWQRLVRTVTRQR